MLLNVVRHQLIFLILIISNGVNCNHSIKKRFLLFQNNTVLQFSSGLSVPLILPRRTINLSLLAQVNYNEPTRVEHLRPAIFEAKTNHQYDFDINREFFYKYIIEFLDGIGLDGEQCLLRIICEISEFPLHLDHRENLLEEIVHYMFTPSIDLVGDNSTVEISFNNKVLQAENFGRNDGQCKRQYSTCMVPLVDIFTTKFVI